MREEDVMKGISLLGGLGVSPLRVPTSWYAVPLRLIVGLGFIEHGFAKLSRGADGFIAILHAIGTPFADLLGWATIGVEIVGGSMILLGAFVPVATVPMIVVLLVAIFTVHLSNGFSSIKLLSYDAMGAHFGQPGYETDLLYIAALLALCVGGAGPLSLDGYLTARKVDHNSAWPLGARLPRTSALDPLLCRMSDSRGAWELLQCFGAARPHPSDATNERISAASNSGSSAAAK
jgi:putative oxidoreductase